MKPLFLYTGTEFGERNDAIQNFRQQVEKRLGSLDYHKLYATDVKITEVVNLLQSATLFEAGRFIILCNAELIKNKEDIEVLNSWQKATQKNKTEDAFLFLVSDEISVDKKLENIIDKENKKVFWEMFEDRKEQWLFNFFQKKGYSIDQDAVECILDLIENNTEALRNECSRFFVCFEKGKRITLADVENILTHNREESAFTLFDAACEIQLPDIKRFENVLTIFQKLKNSKDFSAKGFIAGLTYCFRTLNSWHKLHQQGMPSDFELKIAGFSSKTRQKQYNKASKIWNEKQTLDCLSCLAECDSKILNIGTIVEDTILQTMIYSIILKKGQSIIEYQQS